MKVLVIAFPSGVQWRLMYDQTIPDVERDGFISLIDDYGQHACFTWSDEIALLFQDTDELNKLEVEMMVRQKNNETQAMARLQSDPRNMLLQPGRMMSS